MKHLHLIVISSVTALIAMFAPQQSRAQLRFGVQAGVNVNDFHFNRSTFDADNRVGYNIGAMLEFSTLTGHGFDVAVRYVRRNSRWSEQNGNQNDNRDYIDIPLNYKWRFNVPVINRIVRPFITTGPSFSFLTSRSLSDTYRNRKFDVAWNFGFGLELLQKVQLGAAYGLGMTNAVKAFDGIDGAGIRGKNRYWTVTAAWMF